MTRIDDVARTLDTVGLAAWFGGSLMGAVALANSADDGSLDYENEVWRRWSPVQTAAITAHLVGAATLATTNKGRMGAQRGVSRLAMFKAACTVGALGATVYASRLGRTAHREAVERDDGPADAPQRPTPTMKRLRAVQATVPVLTGAMLVADARLGEQQRPMQVLKGAAERFVPDALHSLPDALHSVPDRLQAIPVADTSRELLSKAGEIGRSTSHASFAEPVRKALDR